jgi:adenylate cyclase
MLYGSLTPARKAALSRLVGKALEQFYQGKTAEIAPALGVLYEGAREFSLAADYFHAASKKAARVFACEEAVVVGRRALDNLRALPETPGRDRRELAILMTMSVPASASRGFSSPEVQRVYDRASELCLAFNETDQLVRVLYGLIQFHTVRLQLESVEEAAERIDHLARDSQERIVAVYSVTGLGLSNYYRGNFEQAMAHFRRAAGACSLEVRRSICATVGYDPTSASSVYVAWCLWWLGYPDRALQELDAAIESAGEVAFRFSLANALTFACALYHWYGDWDRARMYNERARTLSGDEGFSYFVATSVCFEGLWMARHGQRAEGLTRMQEGLDSLRVIDGRASLRRYTTEFAEELAAAGRVDEGLELIAEEIASMRSDRFWEAELLRVHGELCRRRGEAAEAERCLERAIDAARRQRAKSFELRATLSLARLWHEQGKPTEAISRLSEIYHWFPEGSDTADLREARQLLIPDLRAKS